jgi:hypothetical protein
MRIPVVWFIGMMLLVSCNRSPENKLIGTWTMPVICGVQQVTYRADHTCEMFSDARNGPIRIAGEWRLDRDRLITRYNGTEIAATIIRITPEVLCVRPLGAGPEYAYTRAK